MRRRRRRQRFAVASGTLLFAAATLAIVSTRAPSSQSAGTPTTPEVRVAGASETARATSAVPPTASTVAERAGFTLAVTGDILLHMPVNSRAATFASERGTGRYDFRPMFDRVRPLLSGVDLALCHLETPLSPDDADIRGNPVFSSPYEIAAAIHDAGFDGCSTASNHSYDGSEGGVRATLDHLDVAGVGHSGSARTEAEASRARLYDANGVRVAHLAYTTFLNGSHPSEPWMINLAAPERIEQIVADARAARAAGAQFVVVSVHWGIEFARTPSAAQDQLADLLTGIEEIDLVVGHHAHVIQPIERRNGKWVVFGLGNLLSNQHATTCCPAESQDGIVVRITVMPDDAGALAVTTVDYTPTWVDRTSFTVLPVHAAVADPATPEGERDELARSRDRTAEAVRSRGAAVEETPAAALAGGD